jgi:hypothetical protein
MPPFAFAARYALALFVIPVALHAQASSPVLPRTRAPRPTTSDISAADLMTRLYAFADDSMQGREAGSEGHFRATEYLASQVRALGLQPAGDSGTYFQTVPLYSRHADTASTIASADMALRLDRDFVLTGTGSVAAESLQVVFGGVIGETPLKPEQANGKLVVFRMKKFAGFSSLTLPSASRGASGIVITGLELLPDMYRDFFSRPAVHIQSGSPPPAAPFPAVLTTDAAIAGFFHTPLDSLKPGDAGVVVRARYGIVDEPTSAAARNVVAVLPGSDPSLATEYVAFGAHSDHLGFNSHPVDHDSIRIYNRTVRPGGAEDAKARATLEQFATVNAELSALRRSKAGAARPDSIFNGADDDGTGSVALLEIAQEYSASRTKPKRSTLFVWHVGEEKGMLGSGWYTDHPTVPRDSIVAQLNVDMIGRGRADEITGASKEGTVLHGGSDYLQIIGSRRLSNTLGDLVESVNARQTHPFTFDYALDANGHPQNIYCRSDHEKYARYGIPVTFFTTGGHYDYHQVTDEPQYIDYAHFARATRLIADIGLEVANRSERPAVDQAKPDPRAACRQ